MKVKTLSALAGLGGALILSGSADAAYLGLGLQLHTTVVAGGASRSVYRLYAVFNNPEDYTTGGAGSAITGTLTIQSLNSTMTGPGSNFYQNVFGGNLAPSADVVKKSPAAQWDTYATVGVALNNGTDQTATSPGFPTFIAGNSLVSNDMAWFTPGPVEQGRAGGANGVAGAFINFAGNGPLVGLGVQLAQLTVNAGGNVAGTIAVSVVETGIAGGQTIGGQTFASSAIPAPGALALLGLAGLVGARRRRA